MAEITYGAVLKLIRVIERAGINGEWPDFLRAYGLPDVLEPEERPSAGYGDETIEDRRMKRLKTLHRYMDRPVAKQVLEKLVESVLAELEEPGHDHLGLRGHFWDDDDGASYDLNSLRREIEQGGYRIEAGRLVADARAPAESDIDAVTGIGSRNYLNREAATLWAQCRTGVVPAGAVFIDIDRFKGFNDRHGHATGDAVLRAVAQAVQNVVRMRGGVVGRYGGEEFVAVLPNMTEGEVKALGERIREDVGRLRVNGLSITVSVGAASSENSGQSLDELWDMADRSVLQAKSAGRNRTVAFSELTSQ